MFVVEFGNKEIQLYQDGCKPLFGTGLNRRAIVTLQNVWPKSKSGNHNRAVEEIKKANYQSVLFRACERFQGKFTSYNPTTGTWIFEIQNSPSL